MKKSIENFPNKKSNILCSLGFKVQDTPDSLWLGVDQISQPRGATIGNIVAIIYLINLDVTIILILASRVLV
jgi:hypothetical protein